MRKLFFALFVLYAFSCAREVSENARTLEERLLQARIQTKYLDTLHKTESGLYYMILSKGSGKEVEEESFVYVRFSTLNFFNEDYSWGSGSASNPYDDYYGYSSSGSSAPKLLSSDERVAKQLGDFSTTTYYGPHLWYAGVNALMEGIDEIVLSMREGDRRRIWLPSWLSSYGFTGSQPQYSVTTIHDIEILRVIPDIIQFQIDSLEAYRDRHYPGLDSLSWGFYKKTLVEGVGDTLKEGNKVSIQYVGRFLDDFVFDTNIADSAKRYYMYDPSSRDYDPFLAECKEKEGMLTVEIIDSEGGFKEGFTKAILSMKNNEEAVTFFHSNFGYGAEEGSSLQELIGKRQPFSPLVFYIKVERTDSDDDDEEDAEVE